MKRTTMQLMLGLLLSAVTIQYCGAEEIHYGIDKESKKDMVLLHGTILSVEGRYISLDEVTPLCRGKRTFYRRYRDPQVNVKPGKTVWFWLIGSCGHKDDVIDIVAKPEGE